MCPRCHRPFARETERRDFVNREVVTYSKSNKLSSIGNYLDNAVGASYSAKETITKEVVRYKYYYKCKHCGYHWTEISTENT